MHGREPYLCSNNGSTESSQPPLCQAPKIRVPYATSPIYSDYRKEKKTIESSSSYQLIRICQRATVTTRKLLVWQVLECAHMLHTEHTHLHTEYLKIDFFSVPQRYLILSMGRRNQVINLKLWALLQLTQFITKYRWTGQ